MGKYKNPRNQPEPPDIKAKPVRVWFAYLTSHAFVHAGLSALIVGFPLGVLIGLIHWVQDYLKCKIQYSPNLDQIIHISILVIIGIIYTINPKAEIFCPEWLNYTYDDDNNQVNLTNNIYWCREKNQLETCSKIINENKCIVANVAIPERLKKERVAGI